MKVIAFAATSSRKSINKQLVSYAANLVENADVEVLDINETQLLSQSPHAPVPSLAKSVSQSGSSLLTNVRAIARVTSPCSANRSVISRS